MVTAEAELFHITKSQATDSWFGCKDASLLTADARVARCNNIWRKHRDASLTTLSDDGTQMLPFWVYAETSHGQHKAPAYANVHCICECAVGPVTSTANPGGDRSFHFSVHTLGPGHEGGFRKLLPCQHNLIHRILHDLRNHMRLRYIGAGLDDGDDAGMHHSSRAGGSVSVGWLCNGGTVCRQDRDRHDCVDDWKIYSGSEVIL
nr:hypothetical protein CFP56_19679 [Quercus suber]